MIAPMEARTTVARVALVDRAFALPVLFLTIYVIWGITYVFTKIALHDVGPFTFGVMRTVFAVVVLGLAALAMRRTWPGGWRVQLFVAVVGFLNVSGLIGMMTLGLTVVPAGEASLLTYTQPFQVALLSALILHERIRPRMAIGLCAGFAGVVVVLLPRIQPDGTVPLWGYAAMVLGGFSWGLSAVIFRWGLAAGWLKVQPDVLWFAALQSFYGLWPLLVPAIALEGFRLSPTPSLLLALLFVGIFAAGLANLLWFFLLSKRAATVVSTYVFLVPAFAVAFGWLLLGESLSPTLIAGGALTLGGIALVTRR